MANKRTRGGESEEQRQAAILRQVERAHFGAFMHDTPGKAGERPAEETARAPARTPGSLAAVLVNPGTLGLGVIEVPVGPDAVERACEGLGINRSRVAGTSSAERELVQVWVRNTGTGPHETAERCWGWLSGDAWIPIESPESLAATLERAPGCEPVDLLAAAQRLDRTSPGERALRRLETATSDGVEPPSRERLEAVARETAAARRAEQRMHARRQRRLVMPMGQGARARRG